jgi:hypothetical protein
MNRKTSINVIAAATAPANTELEDGAISQEQHQISLDISLGYAQH